MANLCIIPARGGSKRIPRKNIKDFLGKPIIAYSIETALQSGLFEEVMVSTDDEEIAEVAKRYGAKVPFFRSEENSGDHATTVGVLLEVLREYQTLGLSFEYACCIYATAPLIRQHNLTEGYRKLVIESRCSVFPVVKFSYPIWRGLKIVESGKTEMIWPEHISSRSQDLEEVYHDAGQWYWFEVGHLVKNKAMFSENSASTILSALEVQDIDNDTDWQMAELKHELLQRLK